MRRSKWQSLVIGIIYYMAGGILSTITIGLINSPRYAYALARNIMGSMALL